MSQKCRSYGNETLFQFWLRILRLNIVEWVSNISISWKWYRDYNVGLAHHAPEGYKTVAMDVTERELLWRKWSVYCASTPPPPLPTPSGVGKGLGKLLPHVKPSERLQGAFREPGCSWLARESRGGCVGIGLYFHQWQSKAVYLLETRCHDK